MTLADIESRQTNQLDGIAIDGVPAERVCHPESPQEVADLLREANDERSAVYPVGSGLHQRFGRTPERVDVAVSTLGLAGILRYDPEDLVVSVGSGTTLAELQRELGAHGQWLPVEAPGGATATVGGRLALGLIGPRQLGSLSMRDLLLGMSVAMTDGTVVKSGGMVVKNVTGFDMGRLHVGARGTLAVITSANFKVLPRPETEATLLALFESGPSGVAQALAAWDVLRASSLRPVAADVVIELDRVELAVRFEGRPAAVRRQIDALTNVVTGDITAIADPSQSQRWWASHVERFGFDDPHRTVLRLDARPREVAGVASDMVAALGRAGLDGLRVVVSPGLGLIWADVGEAPRSVVTGLLDDLRGGPAGVTIMGAPTAWKHEIMPLATTGPRPVDRALRDQFDPNQILNRGRHPIG